MKHRKFLVKMVCFALAVAFMGGIVDLILFPKYMYDNNWPTTQNVIDFYHLDKDTIDVLFMGSSHCMNAFSPLQLYRDYGISSYNLGTEQQTMLLTYEFLKEALKYQSPQVVVLDTYFLFTILEDEALNASEGKLRKSVDVMRWSPVKIETIQKICEIDTSQSFLSYLFPNIRYHSRWMELNEDDFTFEITANHSALMGFSALSTQCKIEDYQPFDSDSSTDIAQPNEQMAIYMEKIVQLCEDNGIQLILVKTPGTVANVKWYNYLCQYTDEIGIKYIDFNETTVYNETQYNFPTDNYDNMHANVWGAEKLTEYIANVLLDDYGINSREDRQYEDLLDYYEGILKDCTVPTITDMYEYLDIIDDDRYAVLISISEEGMVALDERAKNRLIQLGVTANLNEKYLYAVIRGDKENKASAEEMLFSNGTLRNGTTLYTISSAGVGPENDTSIMIDGTEYAKNAAGMNIVVYSFAQKKVIDSVCFDTSDNFYVTR